MIIVSDLFGNPENIFNTINDVIINEMEQLEGKYVGHSIFDDHVLITFMLKDVERHYAVPYQDMLKLSPEQEQAMAELRKRIEGNVVYDFGEFDDVENGWTCPCCGDAWILASEPLCINCQNQSYE